MPYENVICSFCGKKFSTYTRPSRPEQKDWYCCKEHYYLSGNKRGGGARRTTKGLQEKGYYIKKRQEWKLKQIQSYGRGG